MTLQGYYGRFELPSTSTDFSVGATALSLTAARYYMADSSGPTELVEHLQAIIRTAPAHPGARVALSAAGFITVTLDSTDTVTWTDTDLRDLLGFTGDLSGSDEYTAPNQARYCWFPTIGASAYDGDLTNLWVPRSSSRAYRAPDGTTSTTVGNVIYECDAGYRHLPVGDVLKNADLSVTPYRSLEAFFEDVIHAGEPCRVYPDRTLRSIAGSYKTAIFAPTEQDEPYGSFRNFTDRHIERYQGLWRVNLKLWQHVSG